jgi:hypothetical protein
VGNLDSLTLGHGLIMRNYANSTEFPAIRRIGFNTGIDGGFGGFEALVNDIAAPEIFGARLYMRPIPGFKLALGASGVIDMSPTRDLPAADATALGNPRFVSAGLDLDLPIVTSGFLGIRLFADAAATVPWIVDTPTGGSFSYSTGLKYDLVWNGGKPTNWGAAGGVMGNVLFINYRLEYRYFTGMFKPSFYDTTYDRNRGEYALQYANYVQDPSSIGTNPTIMGVYGEGGFNILKDKFVFTLGYMWPWDPSITNIQDQFTNAKDEFHAKVVIRKGLIPIFDVSGSIGYDRRNVARDLYAWSKDGTKFQLFDQNSVFGGEIVVPVPKTPNLDVAVVFQTVPVRDAGGAIQYADEALGIPKIQPSIGIETWFHF